MIVLLLTILLLLIIYYLLTKRYNYWVKKGVPYLKPIPFFGNYKDFFLLRKHAPLVAHEICQQFPGSPYVGTYFGSKPALIVQDPKLVKQIMAKDFYYFNGRDLAQFSQRERLTQNLFFTDGDTWKVIRHNLTPLFSLSKMKNMFYLIEQSATQFEKLLTEEIGEDLTVEALDLAAKYTIEGIMSCIFGVNTNTMTKNQNRNAFSVIGRKIMKASTSRAMKFIFRALWPELFYKLKLSVYDSEIYLFLYKLLKDVFENRNYKSTNRNDFVDLILTSDEYLTSEPLHSTDKDRLIKLEVTNDLLVAQCSMLFGAGYDTSATIISLTLFELAKNHEIQKRVLSEVDYYFEKHPQGIEYNCVYDMTYLDACIDETLRMYPVAGFMPRDVFSDYTFSTGLHLEKGVRVYIPVYHLHHNLKYYPEPEIYRPERFLGKEKDKIIPYTYLPFGEGPRICLGIRFAKLQMIAGLLVILKNYEIKLADNMTEKITLDPRGIVAQVMGGIYLKFLHRNK